MGRGHPFVGQVKDLFLSLSQIKQTRAISKWTKSITSFGYLSCISEFYRIALQTPQEDADIGDVISSSAGNLTSPECEACSKGPPIFSRPLKSLRSIVSRLFGRI